MKKRSHLIASSAFRSCLTVPFNEREPVDRTQLGPFVRGYVAQSLMPFPFHDLDDMPEHILQQMIRDCIHFNQRAKHDLAEVFLPITEYTEKQAGKDFYKARNREHGFVSHYLFDEDAGPVWERLNKIASDFGMFHLASFDGSLIHVQYEET